ncbi:MAG: hypothetical protein Q8K98_02515 [Bacteroidota bacterium]|nr:hypothetical protein [Bacteroidota bacterium]
MTKSRFCVTSVIHEHPAFKELNLEKSGIQLTYQEQQISEISFVDEIFQTDAEYSLSQLDKLYIKYLNEYNNHKMQPSLNNLTPLQILRTFYDFKSVQYFESL